jgi:hypothetical protein
MSPARGAFLLLFVGWTTRAQVPLGTVPQLDTAIGQRVEATAVLGTQSIASRAGLGWSLNGADGSIFKIPWETELQDPQPLGNSSLLWAPVFEGGVGYGWFANHFNNHTLAGNESDFSTVALSLGVGPRVYFGDSGFSVLPAFSLLYAYTENDFDAHNALGQQVVDDGRYVNWNVQTISLVPSFEFQYKKTFGRWTPKVTSAFAYFNTQPISRSTDALSFGVIRRCGPTRWTSITSPRGRCTIARCISAVMSAAPTFFRGCAARWGPTIITKPTGG